MDEYWRQYWPRALFLRMLGANTKISLIRQKIEEAQLGDLGGFDSARPRIAA